MHRFVGRFAGKSGTSKREQNRLAKIETSRQLQITPHVFRINAQSTYQLAQFYQHVIQQRARIRQNDPLRAGMTDVTLVPKRDVLHRCHRVPAHDSSQPTQPLPGNWIAFVRHGRAPLLAFAEKFFHFQNFSALKVSEFGSPAVDRRCDQCQGRQKFSVAIALHDLGRDCSRTQPEFLANLALDPRIQMRVCPHRAAEFPDANALTRLPETLFCTAKLIEHQRQL